MNYSFEYKDSEGDEYTSEDFTNKAGARIEIARLKAWDPGTVITDTFIDDDEGNFKGRW